MTSIYITSEFKKLKTSYLECEILMIFFRVKVINNGSDNFIWPIMPNFKLFFATDPELGHFLLNIQPDIIRKAGFSRELFGGDKNGFLYGLLYDEGESWQRNRKLIGKQLHLSVLESYIEVSQNPTTSCL